MAMLFGARTSERALVFCLLSPLSLAYVRSLFEILFEELFLKFVNQVIFRKKKLLLAKYYE